MCIGAETEIKRYVPPRKGKLTLVITDGFTLKVSLVIAQYSMQYIFLFCLHQWIER